MATFGKIFYLSTRGFRKHLDEVEAEIDGIRRDLTPQEVSELEQKLQINLDHLPNYLMDCSWEWDMEEGWDTFSSAEGFSLEQYL